MTSSLPDRSSSDNGGIREWPEQEGEAQQGHDGMNEHSPLLQAADSGGDGADIHELPSQGHGDEERTQATKSPGYLIVLTICIAGLQVAWATELSYGSPYLLSLGLSKSLMALVWIAGPLTGTLVQPYIGMWSDNCRVSWGRRKPFMLVGSAATVVSLLFLSWTREIVEGVLGLFGADPTSSGVQVCAIIVAVLWVYVLDIAVNSVQATIRAFIVDGAPAHQQEAANAMASRLLGMGNIVGYVAGYANLPKYLPWLGRTQFQILSTIASIALCITVAISTGFIRERDPRLEGPPSKDGRGLLSFFRAVFSSIKQLPPQTRKVCIVQFVSWVGFFPMLFYTSSFVGDVYVQPFLEENPHMTKKELDALYEEATRVGTFALLIFAITSLSTNVLLPFFIDPTYDKNLVVSNDSPNMIHDDTQFRKWLRRLVVPGLTLRRAWMWSQVLFAASTICTPFVSTVRGATTIIGLLGITWGMTLWAPFAIISAEISRLNFAARMRKQRMRAAPEDDIAGSSAGQSMDHEEQAHGKAQEQQMDEDDNDKTGVILGIHNMAIAAPQFIATFVSSIIFRILQKPRGVPGDHSISVVFALGGICVLAASFIVHRIKDDTAEEV